MSLSRKNRPLTSEVDGLEALFRGELAGDADRDLLDVRVHRPARLDGVLLLQGLDQLGNVEPHGGELLRGELQVDFFVLGTEEVDFRHVRHAEQFGAHALGIVAQLALVQNHPR